MYYSKKEEYSFACPREFKAYLAFKNRLKEIGIPFIDEGGNMFQIISITTSGRFDVNEDCDILSIIKEPTS